MKKARYTKNQGNFLSGSYPILYFIQALQWIATVYFFVNRKREGWGGVDSKVVPNRGPHRGRGPTFVEKIIALMVLRASVGQAGAAPALN